MDFVVWLGAFILHAALVGRSMFAVLTTRDFREDLLNAFDFEKKINRWVVAELAAQASLVVVLLVGGKWFSAVLQASMLAYLLHLWQGKKLTVLVGDAYKEAKGFESRRVGIVVFYMVTFVLAIYRLIEAAVFSLLTPEGRETTRKLLQDMATLHGY